MPTLTVVSTESSGWKEKGGRKGGKINVARWELIGEGQEHERYMLVDRRPQASLKRE